MPVPLGALLTSISVLSLDRSGRNELAGGEVIEGAEAAGELVGAQAAVAVERAHKFFRVALGLERIAIQAARDEVAARIGAELRLRHDVVDALLMGHEPAQAIEAAASLAAVDGAALRMGPEEIGLRDGDRV
jgi:hypothetical protein